MFLPFSLSSAAWLSTIYIISLCASKVNSISKLYTFAIALLPLMKEHFIFRTVISGRGAHFSGGGVPPLPLPRSLSGRFSAFRLALTFFVIGFCFFSILHPVYCSFAITAKNGMFHVEHSVDFTEVCASFSQIAAGTAAGCLLFSAR